MLQSPVVLGFVYVLAALVFALIYFGMWRYSPDSFIVHQELNLRPLSSWRKLHVRFRSPDAIGKSDPSPTPLERINSEYSTLKRQENELAQDLARVESEMKKTKEAVKELTDQHNSEMVKNMDSFIKEEERKREAGLERMGADLKRKLAEAKTGDDFARLSQEADAAIAAAVGGSGSATLSQFAKTSVLEGLDDAYAREAKVSKQYLDLLTRYQQVRQNQEALLEAWEKERLGRLGLLEFIYFSLGVATSNTFGDLIPNDRLIRVIIVVQLVISVLLVGLFLAAITNPGSPLGIEGI